MTSLAFASETAVVKHTVGVAEMKIGVVAGEILITHALGSCLGITIHDPVAGVGGLLHVMLPDSTIDPHKSAQNPAMFVDTGVPRLFHACYNAGAEKGRIVLKVAGGACTSDDEEHDYFKIGKRNVTALRKLLWKNGVLLKASDVGGTKSRTMTLEIGSGEVLLRTNGETTKL
jgi:chemotaxis protein CheD